MDDKPLTFDQGFVFAVSCLVRMHGLSTEAKDLMHEAGHVDWTVIAKTDIDTLSYAGILKRNCQDCGRFVERGSWSCDPNQNPLCLECRSMYDNPEFM